MGSPQRPHTTSSRVSLPSPDLGGFPYQLAHISLTATEVGGLGNQFIPSSSFLLNLMLELSLLLFFSELLLTRFASSSTCSMPKRKPPGAFSVAKHNERMFHKRGRITGDAGGEKHLPLLIKMWRFALSRRVGSRPGEQMEPQHSSVGSSTSNSSHYRQQIDTSGHSLAALLYRAPCRNAPGCDVGEICSVSSSEEREQPLPPASPISPLGITGGDEMDPSRQGPVTGPRRARPVEDRLSRSWRAWPVVGHSEEGLAPK